MNQENRIPPPKLGILAVMAFMFLCFGCQRKATAATVRELERRLILLELKLRETEGRLTEQIDQIAQAQAAKREPEAVEPEIPPEVTPTKEEKHQPAAAAKADGPNRGAPTHVAEAVEPAASTTTSQESKKSGGSDVPQIAKNEVKAIYKKALAALESRQLDRAEQLLRAVLAQHADHRLAPNAAYWLGEVFYSRYQFQRAIEAFGNVIRDYPKSHKVADALLKQGRCHERLGQLDQARAAYQNVIEQFPQTPAAALARKWL